MPLYKKSGPIVHGGEFLATRTVAQEYFFFRENSDDQVGRGCYAASSSPLAPPIVRRRRGATRRGLPTSTLGQKAARYIPFLFRDMVLALKRSIVVIPSFKKVFHDAEWRASGLPSQGTMPCMIPTTTSNQCLDYPAALSTWIQKFTFFTDIVYWFCL